MNFPLSWDRAQASHEIYWREQLTCRSGQGKEASLEKPQRAIQLGSASASILVADRSSFGSWFKDATHCTKEI